MSSSSKKTLTMPRVGERLRETIEIAAAGCSTRGELLSEPILLHTDSGPWYLKSLDQVESYTTRVDIIGAGSFKKAGSDRDPVQIELDMRNLTSEGLITFQ